MTKIIEDNFTTLAPEVLPIDDTAPNISNIVVSPSVNSCLIIWNTNELANGEIMVGNDTAVVDINIL